MSFSVVIPAHNASKHIERSVKSVLRQTMEDFEILVIENGSSDNTQEAVEQIEDSRLRLIRNKTPGVSLARNTGIANAKHQWIALLDADDEWLPHHLEIANRVLSDNRDLRWFCSAYDLKDEQDQVIRSIILPEKSYTNNRIPDYLVAARRTSYMHSSTGIIHKDIFDTVGGFDEDMHYGEDHDMWFRIGLRYPETAYSNTLSAHYHRHPGSATGPNTHHDPERSFNSILKLHRICLEEAPHRAAAAKSLISNKLERWIRLCAKANRRDLLSRLDEMDSRLVEKRIRLLSILVSSAPERLISYLRKRSDYVSN